jgi:hypothetical protein
MPCDLQQLFLEHVDSETTRDTYFENLSSGVSESQSLRVATVFFNIIVKLLFSNRCY